MRIPEIIFTPGIWTVAYEGPSFGAAIHDLLRGELNRSEEGFAFVAVDVPRALEKAEGVGLEALGQDVKLAS
jgi:hypothetical protein